MVPGALNMLAFEMNIMKVIKMKSFLFLGDFQTSKSCGEIIFRGRIFVRECLEHWYFCGSSFHSFATYFPLMLFHSNVLGGFSVNRQNKYV